MIRRLRFFRSFDVAVVPAPPLVEAVHGHRLSEVSYPVSVT